MCDYQLSFYFSQYCFSCQVDQLVFEELMRERFPKLGHTFDLFSHLSYLFGMYFHYETYGSIAHLFMLLVQLNIWITWECKWHGSQVLGSFPSL